jgi:CBS domain containing-hemolysin-like protein
MRVADIMVPRADMYAVDLDATLAELLAEFRESGHSRMPVYRETLDDGVGVIHVKDLVDYMANAATVPARGKKGPGIDFSRLDLSRTVAESDLVREVLFVPPSMPVANLLALMKSQRRQMALVIDEFGGTDGLVSIEDAVETIVGEIEDEHDEEEPPEIVAEKNGSFVMDAGSSLDDVAAAVGGDFAKDRDDKEVDTIGGVVFSLLGRIPTTGEKVSVPGFEIQILDADQRRIHRLRIRPVPPEASEPAEPVTDIERAASRA